MEIGESSVDFRNKVKEIVAKICMVRSRLDYLSISTKIQRNISFSCCSVIGTGMNPRDRIILRIGGEKFLCDLEFINSNGRRPFGRRYRLQICCRTESFLPVWQGYCLPCILVALDNSS